MRRTALFLCAFAAAVPLASADWPQFRGPEGSGISTARGVPLAWSETKNVRWKTAIHGRAWSSPVVLGDHPTRSRTTLSQAELPLRRWSR